MSSNRHTVKDQAVSQPTDVSALSYTEFVAFVNQWNVPPGAFTTLAKWQTFGGLTDASTVLEIACTTGFSSRELALQTGARVTGVDVCRASIDTATQNAARYAPSARLDYRVADVLEFVPAEKYSHVVTGAALRFFPNPRVALDRITGWLQAGGFLLSCEFYCISSIPDSLVSEAQEVFGISITQATYKEVMSLYQDLSLVYEDRQAVEPETPAELEHYCDSLVSRFADDRPQTDAATLNDVRRRLMSIKDMSNRLRPYQGYNVLVHRLDPRFYPHRYIELF